ncbi:MAG: hypothetical protein ACRDYC_08715 [Acidimicrobiales bacterium]
MASRASSALVEHHLGLIETTKIEDSPSAYAALGHAMAAVGAINLQLDASSPPPTAFAGPLDDVVAHLEGWISRLGNSLTAIATQLGASFSITVGTAITVTISCGPFRKSAPQ